MSIDITAADAHFGTKVHIRSGIWNGFDRDLRQSALVQARRDIERLLGEAIAAEDETSADGDFPRYDLAVFEQALWILVNSAVANGEQTTPKWMLTGDPEARDGGEYGVRMGSPGMSPTALEWLVTGGQVTLSRG